MRSKLILSIVVCIALLSIISSIGNIRVNAQYNCSYYNAYCCSYYNYYCYGYCPYYSYYCNYGTYGYQTTTTTQTQVVTQFNTATQTVVNLSTIIITTTSMYPTIDTVAIYNATMPLYLDIGGLVALLLVAMLVIWGLFAKYDVTPKPKEVT